VVIVDYVGFIKKVMKQLQQPRYILIRRIDVDLRQLDEDEVLSVTPGNCDYMNNYLLFLF
jgi:hypothetical protein